MIQSSWLRQSPEGSISVPGVTSENELLPSIKGMLPWRGIWGCCSVMTGSPELGVPVRAKVATS